LDPGRRTLRSGSTEYEERWERAGLRDAERREPLSVLRNLEGAWKVERLSGPLPMPFVWKRIEGGRGETHVLPSWWRGGLLLEPQLPFGLEQREGHVDLIYCPPLSFLVDQLRLEEDGTWLGRANVAGFQYAWFQMFPIRTP
jgi:hypothetical protein